MVQAAHAAAEQVRLLVGEVLSDVRVPRGVEDLHGVLLRVGVQVTEQHDVVRARRLLLLVREVDEGLGLAHAVGVRIALAVAVVDVALAGAGPLRLEVVDDRDERLVVLAGRERLGQRFAGIAERVAAREDRGVADGLDVGRLVDERGADDVLALRQLFR